MLLSASLEEHERQRLTPFRYVSAAPAYSSVLATNVGARTVEINVAYAQLKDSVISRGIQYANNPVASRGGFMTENFVAESYNLDAVLKETSAPPAIVPAENGSASADILYGEKSASVKVYSDGKSSGKAQLNPAYGDQDRVVPHDQLEEARATLEKLADKNAAKGRTEAAKQQRDVAKKLTDCIKDEQSGVESTPITKKQSTKMADAIKKESDGTVTVDEEKIDQVMDETGVSGRVSGTKWRNELSGLGKAVAIGFGIGVTLSFVAELARVGLDSEQIGDVMFNSLVTGTESGAIAGTAYAAGRGVAYLMDKAGVNLMSSSGRMLNCGVTGVLATAIICVYTFAKAKYGGADDDEALAATGNVAKSSLTILAVTLAMQWAFGGPVTIIVSAGISVVALCWGIATSVHTRQLEARIREFSIEEYKRLIDRRKPIFLANLP